MKEKNKLRTSNIKYLPETNQIPLNNKKLLAFAVWIIGFCLVTRLLTLGIMPLVDPSEGRYALVSQEMAETGDYITPMIWISGKNLPYWGKPPLYFWLGSFSFKVFGSGEFAARFPSYFSAGMLLALIYWIIKRFRSEQVAILSLVIILTSGGMFYLSGVVLMDMTLTLFTSGALLFYYAFLCEDNRLNKKLFSLGIFSLLALGFLTKGPVALIIFGIPVFFWHLLNKRWKILKEHSWFLGGPLFIFIVLPWFYMAELKTPGFLKYFFLNENFYRFFKKGYGDLYGTGHKHLLGTAILYFWAMAAPWSIIALFFIVKKTLATSGNFKSRLKQMFNTINNHPFMQGIKIDFFLICFTWIILFWCLAKQIHLYYLILAVPTFGIWLASFINTHKISKKKVLTFSLITQFVYLVSIFIIAHIVNNIKSTKMILDYAKELKAAKTFTGDIIFVRKTPYSAYFYGKDLILIHPTETIEESLLRGKSNNDSNNLYLIKHKYFNEMKSQLKKQFQLIYSSNSWTILKYID